MEHVFFNISPAIVLLFKCSLYGSNGCWSANELPVLWCHVCHQCRRSDSYRPHSCSGKGTFTQGRLFIYISVSPKSILPLFPCALFHVSFLKGQNVWKVKEVKVLTLCWFFYLWLGKSGFDDLCDWQHRTKHIDVINQRIIFCSWGNQEN